MEEQKVNRKVVAGVAALLIVLIAQVLLSVHKESLSWDEGDHIFAGYMSLKHGDYGLNPEHPPLVKKLATLPLLPLSLLEPKDQHRYFKLEAYFDGRDMIFGSPGYNPDDIIFRVRVAASLLTLVLGLLVFLAANEMFGTRAGFLALTLIAFEPTVLAHGAYVTTDIGISCFIFATIYSFYRYVKQPSLLRLLVFGLALGLALATKHSAILLFPMLVFLCIYELVARNANQNSESFRKLALRLAGASCAATVIGLVILWAFYGFRYSARPAGMTIGGSPLLEFAHALKPLEEKVIVIMARLHFLPESYLYGLTDVRAMANFMPSYILGKVYAHGVWFYFPVAFVIKSTLGVLGFFVLSCTALLTRKLPWSREICYLTIPPAFYLLVAMTSSLNIGIRHLLPIYVFLAVLAAGASLKLIQSRRTWGYVVAVLLVLHIASSLRNYPVYMSYANELVGGPSATYKYLSDSNTDWGQQLKSVKKYLDQRGTKECWFAYFVATAIRPSDYGIPCKLLPTADTGWFGADLDVPPTIHGPVLLSAGSMSGFELGSSVLNPYTQFEKMEPTTSIEHGILVFDGTFQVPHASAMCHAQRSSTLREANKLPEALAEAQTAVSIDPDALQSQMALGEAMAAVKQTEPAKEAFQKALLIAQTMEPSAQMAWLPRIQHKIDELQK